MKDKLIIIENSSNITGYFYELEKKLLFIQFKGGALYRYDDVPQDIADGFAVSESKGVYLAVNIKDKFKYAKFKDTSENIA